VSRGQRDCLVEEEQLGPLRRPITGRHRSLYSQRQTSQALLAQRRFSKVRVAGS
jgi:hypothetical protein